MTVTDACLAERGCRPAARRVQRVRGGHFAVDHATFQIEPQSHRDHEDLGEAHA